MTKQEEIQRAFTDKILTRHPEMTRSDAEWEAVVYKRLLDELGVVIKVDRELPSGGEHPNPYAGWDKDNAYYRAQNDYRERILDAGYVATVPLVEVKEIIPSES